jgi:hypothetical protein
MAAFLYKQKFKKFIKNKCAFFTVIYEWYTKKSETPHFSGVFGAKNLILSYFLGHFEK